MCYGCSIACHADHEVLELFPKRNFRCDCGLKSKFGGAACELDMESKAGFRNDDNTYNHNFIGQYCRCNVQYDPEKEEGTMYQCVTCEDWFHEGCIGKVPPTDDWDDYICRDCTTKYPFVVNTVDKRFVLGILESGDKVTRLIDHKKGPHVLDDIVTRETSSDANPLKRRLDEGEVLEASISKKTKLDAELPTTTDMESKARSNHDPKELHADKLKYKTDVFLRETWRDGLCRCDKCRHSYLDNHISYLLTAETTYEPEEDEDAGNSIFEEGMKQLMRMDRVKAIESTMAYNTMASQIKEFLTNFKDTNKTVTKQDIEGFFAQKLEERRGHKG
ncbi:hypothetical protein BC943DRAFT_313222 [Umbelopsis sp. AD052]|nr:hypothetical protein BC943DRAFT_313222 [Umbelopsis sp. AD052]